MTTTNNLVAFYLALYNAGKAQLLLLLDTGVCKEVFLSTYKMLVSDKSMPCIEQLPEEEKKALVSECRSTGLFFNNESLTNAARILYTIKFINDNSIVDA